MAEEQKTNDLPEVENIDMQEELTKLEDEINTLKQVWKKKENLLRIEPHLKISTEP